MSIMFAPLPLVLLSVVAASFASVAEPREEQRTGTAIQTGKGAGEQARPPADLRGVWKVVEQSSRSPGGDWTVGTTPHLSMYIFTQGHYSYMFAPGDGPRRLFNGGPNRPTDAEKVAAYDSFVAGSGTYVLSGSTLTLAALLHKNPHEMSGAALRYSVEIDGTTLRMTITNPPFAPGRERRTVLSRIE